MIGMDRETGRRIEGTEHLAQSIADILSTPVGSRVRRRDYGSLLFQLIDAPFNALTRLQMFAATALALGRWEPRIRLTKVDVAQAAPGRVEIALEGYRTDAPDPNSLVRLKIPLRLAASAAVA